MNRAYSLRQANRFAQGASSVWRYVREGGPGVPITLVFAFLFLLYALLNPSALTPSGMMTLADEYTALALAAVGETTVVLMGGIDLSVGAIIALVNVILAVHMGPKPGSQLGLTAFSILVATACGLLNGVFVAFLRLPPIIVTLATMFVWNGVSLLILPLPGGSVPPSFVNALTGALGGAVPVALLILVAVSLLTWYLSHSRFGIRLLALGGSEEAVHVLGLSVRRVKLMAYALSGLFYGLAGVFLTSQTGSGDPTIGASFLLETFAAVAVGGTPFGGGRGTLFGSIVGALVLGIITNLLLRFGVTSFATPIFYGLVLLVAVALASPKLRRALGPVFRRSRPPRGTTAISPH